MRVYLPSWKAKDGTRQTGGVYRYQFHLNGRLYRGSLKTRDKRVAEEKARTVFQRTERLSVGMIDPIQDEQQRPLADHIADFEAVLRSGNVGAEHLADRLRSLREYVEATKATHLRDIEASRTARWLGDLKATGAAARTINRRLQALRQLTRWCVQTRRLPYDPLLSLKPLNEAADRRHVRRALSPDELARLLDAAARRPLEQAVAQRVNAGVSAAELARLTALGRMRALVYAVAAGTGLRRGELQRLRWQDLDLDRRLLSVPAASAKSRKDQGLPLRSDLAEALAAYRPADAKPSDPVFAPGTFPRLTTFKADLVHAGLARLEDGRIVTEDQSGRALDFHCLRVTMVSGLVARGVHPRVAQALARHAKIETTMGAYTDVALLDLRGAVEATASRPVPSRLAARSEDRAQAAKSG